MLKTMRFFVFSCILYGEISKESTSKFILFTDSMYWIVSCSWVKGPAFPVLYRATKVGPPVRYRSYICEYWCQAAAARGLLILLVGKAA